MSITAANDWHDPAVSVRDLLANATRDFCSGNLAGAEHLYREIVEDYPDQPEAWFLLGLIALKAGDEARALAAVERAIALRPARALYHLYAGDLYRQPGGSTTPWRRSTPPCSWSRVRPARCAA